MNKIILVLSVLCLSVFVKTDAQERPRSLKRINEIADSISVAGLKKTASPLIGLSASNSNGASRLSGAYIDAIIKAGGTPIIIPVNTDVGTIYNIVKILDGIVLTGGGDVNPDYYNENPLPYSLEVDTIRDDYELLLLKLAVDRNIPILGICRGEQLINVAFGGTLYQDIPTQYKQSTIKHRQTEPREQPTHNVNITIGTQLADILGGTKNIGVNTIHHQAVKKIAPGFKVNAVATDGLVEGIEAYPDRPILAIQWHPEALVAGGDSTMLKIFDFIVKEADIYRKAKDIHKRILSVDTHTDTPLLFKEKGFDIANRGVGQVDIPKMTEGMLDGVFMAAYIRQGARDKMSSGAAVRKVTGLIEGIHNQVEMNASLSGIARNPEDLIRLKQEGKKAIFIGIENGYGIGKDISNLAKYKDMGVTYMTLCHTSDNDICDTSSKSNKEWGGLSPFGKKVIQEMNDLGIMIDVSHAGESTFWDVVKLSSKPIIASHSSAQALCYHDRNLNDKQLQAIAKNNGVVQVCLVDIFINKNSKKASVSDAVDHIDHIVKVAGINHVGIGSDFDGGGGLIGCQGANDLINITTQLIKRGYSEENIAKIWGGNFLRVMKEVQAK